ncbi:MAG: hypothetical protein KF740_13770 [Ramlibacter sp.]|nr:hypothetical protein [Ramlibacter sp.]
MKKQTPDELFTAIARQHLDIETLVERRMDGLDFHEVGVVGLRRALQAAYEAGQAQRQAQGGAA